MEISSINRLQFRHNPHVFASKEEAINEFNKIFFEQKGASSPEPYSLLAEPTVLLYKNEDDDTYLAGTTTKRNPHAILAIGVNSNNNTTYNENRYIFIDVHDLYTKIGNNKKAIEDAIKALTVNALTSESLALYSETTEDGTVISGEVKVADDYRIWNTSKDRYETLTNNILFADGSDPTQRGMYMYVDIDYTEGDSAFTFSVSHSDKTVTEKKVTFHNNYVTGGTYDIESQKIKLFLKEGGDPIEIDCTYLINEWKADDGTKTPVILKKNRLKFDDDTQSFQDVLSANIRIKDEMLDADGNPMRDETTGQYKKSSGSTNILSRDGSSYQSLFVDGRASNIIYYGAEGKTNVKDELDKLNKLRIANDGKNIIVGKFDGFYASVDVNYEKVVKDGATKQELVLYTSGLDVEGKIITNKKEIEIPIAQFIDEVWYDESTEELVISYVDGKGDKRYTRINVGSLIDEWDVFNEAHSVKLNKQRSVSGKDLLSADVKITTSHPNNILMDVNHELYVRGEADNIKYNTTNSKYSSVATVKDGLDTLIANLDQEIADRIADIDAEMNRATSAETALSNAITAETAAREADVDAEEARATAAETILTNKIGSGFTDDPHENVTAKFEGEVARAQSAEIALSEAITTEKSRAESAESDLSRAVSNEVTRATNAENDLDDKITAEKNRAQVIESDLRTDLSTEINNRIAAEDILTNKIGTGFTDQADSNVTFKFNALSDKLNTEISDREADVDAEEARAIAEEQRIEGRLTTEITRATNAENNLDDKIGSGFTTSDTNNVTAKFNTLSGKLDTEIQNRIADVDAEETRATAKENAISGKLDTEISDRKEYAVHSADYVKDDNAIYLRNSTGHVISTINTSDFIKDGMVDSVEIKIIEGVSYLVITFNTDSGKSDIKIPLTDIFNPSNYYTKGEVNTISGNLQTAINNEVTRATSADTALQTAIDNEKTRAEGVESDLRSDLTAETNARTSADTALQTAIDNEKSRAEGVESGLRNDLTAETNARTSADTALQTAITTEKTRAEGVETILNNAITAETSARTSVDNALRSDLNAEVSRATNSEGVLSDAINTETTARTAADNALQTNITAEETRATSEEQRIEGKLDQEIADRIADVNAEEARALAAEAALQTAINNEVSRAQTAEGTLRSDLNAEVSRATGIEQGLRSDLTSEIARAQGAEAALQTAIDNESTARTAADNALHNEITAETTARSAAIINETTARTAADNALHNEITAETNRSISAETEIAENLQDNAVHSAEYNSINHIINFKNATGAVISTIDASDFIKDGMVDKVEIKVIGSVSYLVITFNTDSGKSDIQIPLTDIFNPSNYYTKTEINAYSAATDARINGNATAIANETTARTAADNTLQANIDAEANTRDTNDATLDSKITTEVNRAQGIEQGLRDDLSAEINNRIADVNAEETRAMSAETALQTAINNEVTRATNKDSEHDTKISANETAINNEVTRATSAETTLQTAITTEKTRAEGVESGLSAAINNLTSQTGTISASTLTIKKNGVDIMPTYSPTGGPQSVNIEVPTSVTALSEYNSSTNTLGITSNINTIGSITANAFYSTSDINLKENINLADDVKKAQANKIEVKSFNFKSDEKKAKVYGVIAQEVEAEGLNEVVITKDDGYKAVDYTSLMMLKIAYLEKENRELRSMIEDIQKKLG